MVWLAGGKVLPGLWRHEILKHLGRRHAVGQGMVHLGDRRDPAALVVFHHPQLPQGAVPVQRRAGDVLDELRQFLLAAWRGQRGAMDVQGASKKISFNEKGDSGSTYKVIIVKDNAFVPYWDPDTGNKY